MLDTCVVPDKCDSAVGAFVSPEFTVTKDYVNLLIAGGTHPLGTSGSRLTATLLHEMQRRQDVRYGLVTMCVGVGQGAAVIYEKV